VQCRAKHPKAKRSGAVEPSAAETKHAAPKAQRSTSAQRPRRRAARQCGGAQHDTPRSEPHTPANRATSLGQVYRGCGRLHFQGMTLHLRRALNGATRRPYPQNALPTSWRPVSHRCPLSSAPPLMTMAPLHSCYVPSRSCRRGDVAWPRSGHKRQGGGGGGGAAPLRQASITKWAPMAA